MHRSMLCAVVVTACLAASCAEPPSKEINQAQGAIDAARAAGAERYAEAEFKAATAALDLSNRSVSEGDYRMALNAALESREHAQNAAREAAENGARIRGEVERAMAEIAGLMAQVDGRLATAQRSRIPRQTLRQARESIAQVNASVQKAGEAMNAGDYTAAQTALVGVKERMGATFDALQPARSQSSRRRR